MFNFGVIEGIMRFEGPIPVPKSEKGEVDSKTRKREDLEDEDLDIGLLPSYAEDHLPHDYSEKDFFLGANDKPIARRQTCRYRWRGSETGEGEIQLDSNQFFRSIASAKREQTMRVIQVRLHSGVPLRRCESFVSST